MLHIKPKCFKYYSLPFNKFEKFCLHPYNLASIHYNLTITNDEIDVKWSEKS